jgi:hypothetical protein
VEAFVLYFNNWMTFGPFIGFYLAMTVFIAFDGYYIGLGRLNFKLALELAIYNLNPCNWTSKVRKCFASLAVVPNLWYAYPRGTREVSKSTQYFHFQKSSQDLLKVFLF